MGRLHTKEAKIFKKTIEEIQEVSWENLPENKLADMYEAIRESQRGLCENLKGVQDELNRDIENNDVLAFETHHHEAQRIESHSRQLEQAAERLYNTRQRVIVRFGIKKVLGPMVAGHE